MTQAESAGSKIVRLITRHILMVDGYRPSAVGALIVSWRARGAIDKAASWRGLASGGFREDTIDCAHYEILMPPAVSGVAAGLDAALRQASEPAIADEAAE